MFWLIESYEQLNEFALCEFNEAFIELVPFNNNTHPVNNYLSLIYVRPLNSHKGYIIPVNHSESFNIDQSVIETLLKKYKKIYVRDKKEFLHYIVLPNIFDITLNSSYDLSLTKTHEYFYNKYYNKKDINRIIPISKHYEYCEKIFDDLKSKIYEPINNFFNQKATVVFNAIERMGLRVYPEQFQNKFHPIENDLTYTQYNFKTTTTRPSNRFKGVNYAALNKEDNTRKIFIPRNSKLIEIDIRAYHPTLLSHLINYDFKNEDIHQEFANMYGVNYIEAKSLTFRQLYGGIFPQYKNLEFFQLTQTYTDNLWNKFNNDGKITTPISEHCFYKEKLPDMNPPKLLNYLLQALETANNINILWDIFKVLRGKSTKLILYTFDSFLLDFQEGEEEVLIEIRKIFKKYKLNIKEKEGYDYNF
jgi:hypothetical protein